MERSPTKAQKVLKALECMREVSSSAIESCWNKSLGKERQDVIIRDEEEEIINLELEPVQDETITVAEEKAPVKLKQASIRNYFGPKSAKS